VDDLAGRFLTVTVGDGTMREAKASYYRAMFYSAAVFNVCAGFAMLAAFDEMYQFTGGAPVPQAPVFNLLLHLVSALVLLFAGVYYWLGRDPAWSAGRPVALISLLGKLLFFGVFTAYAMAGLAPWPLVALFFVDFIYALLFLEYVRSYSTLD
jgi:hypothetical protein